MSDHDTLLDAVDALLEAADKGITPELVAALAALRLVRKTLPLTREVRQEAVEEAEKEGEGTW